MVVVWNKPDVWQTYKVSKKPFKINPRYLEYKLSLSLGKSVLKVPKRENLELSDPIRIGDLGTE